MARPAFYIVAACCSVVTTALVSPAPEGACDAAAGGCSNDLFSTLQLGKRGAKQKAVEPEWREAVELEKEVFAQLQAEGKAGSKFGPIIRTTPEPWSTPNAQADPATEHPKNGWTPLNSDMGAPLDFSTEWDRQAAITPSRVTGKVGWDPPHDELRELPTVRSENGFLDVTLTVEAGYIEVPWTGVRYRTRLYNGSYPGPTIRVKRGDHLRLRVVNKLEKSAPNHQSWQRREGQETSDQPHGLAPDDPQYQYVGQSHADPNKMKGVPNNFHNINVTNVHTHGWHVSPNTPQDNVLDTIVQPGDTYVYDFFLSPYHNSGNSWYHPHLHGSVTPQMNGGMLGGLIVDDDEGEAPAWIAEAREITTVIHEADWSYFGPKFLKYFPDDPAQGCFPFNSRFTMACAVGHRTGLLANLSGDLLWKMEYKKGYGFADGDTLPITSFLSVNGQYRPKFSMKTGEWVRLRLIFGSANDAIAPTFDSSACEMQLIAKDSAWLGEVPRKLTKGVWLGAGNRAQVMIRCSKPGTYKIFSNYTGGFQVFASYDLMVVEVSGEPPADMPTPTPQKTDRPRYLASLMDVSYQDLYTPEVPNKGITTNLFNGKPVALNGTVGYKILKEKTLTSWMTFDFVNGIPPAIPRSPTAYEKQPMRFTINNMTFNQSVPGASFQVAEMIELALYGVNSHSWHMHVHPVQLHEWEGTGTAEAVESLFGNYFLLGDWQDVLQLPGAADEAGVKVRFHTDCYTGRLVVHCHLLYHEDMGMMNWYNTTGEDLTINDMFQNEGIYKNPPAQCTKKGQQCAPPQCTNYQYGAPGKK